MLNKYGEVISNACLEKYNTYGIKTSCNYLVKVDSTYNLVSLISYLNEENISYYILGKGSNVILSDNHFNGVIISLEKINNIEISGNKVCADAGVLLSLLSQKCIDNNLRGLEHLALIPGTLGGALYGNAGVKEHTIYDNLISVDVLRNNKIITLLKKDIDISYRYTSFKVSNDIILSASFEFENGNKEEMQNIVNLNRKKRLETQPLEFKNAGSVFRNPEGSFAGKLIESLGLKGYSVGDAEISNKHANFIINKGNATGEDIRELINIVQEKVKMAYNIELVLEQVILDWE